MTKNKYNIFDIKTLKFLLKRKKIRVKNIEKEIPQIEEALKWKKRYKEYKKSGGKTFFKEYKKAITKVIKYAKSKKYKKRMDIIKQMLAHK